MANDPAFLFYSKDWLQGTSQMSADEKGVYIDLLCHQHQENGLPNNTKRLARMSHLSESDFIPIWEFLKEKFIERDGKLFNKKLESVIGGRKEHGEMRTIIGTFGQYLKQANLDFASEKEIRKVFDFKLFIGVDKQELSKSIAKFIANEKQKLNGCLANDGNENANTNVFKERVEGLEEGKAKFNQRPKPEDFNGLPEGKILSAIEIVAITKYIKVDADKVKRMWIVFKNEVLNGKKFYQAESEVYEHFLNWFKKQDFKPEKTQAPQNVSMAIPVATDDDVKKYLK